MKTTPPRRFPLTATGAAYLEGLALKHARACGAVVRRGTWRQGGDARAQFHAEQCAAVYAAMGL